MSSEPYPRKLDNAITPISLGLDGQLDVSSFLEFVVRVCNSTAQKIQECGLQEDNKFTLVLFQLFNERCSVGYEGVISSLMDCLLCIVHQVHSNAFCRYTGPKQVRAILSEINSDYRKLTAPKKRQDHFLLMIYNNDPWEDLPKVAAAFCTEIAQSFTQDGCLEHVPDFDYECIGRSPTQDQRALVERGLCVIYEQRDNDCFIHYRKGDAYLEEKICNQSQLRLLKPLLKKINKLPPDKKYTVSWQHENSAILDKVAISFGATSKTMERYFILRKAVDYYKRKAGNSNPIDVLRLKIGIDVSSGSGRLFYTARVREEIKCQLNSITADLTKVCWNLKGNRAWLTCPNEVLANQVKSRLENMQEDTSVVLSLKNIGTSCVVIIENVISNGVLNYVTEAAASREQEAPPMGLFTHQSSRDDTDDDPEDMFGIDGEGGNSFQAQITTVQSV